MGPGTTTDPHLAAALDSDASLLAQAGTSPRAFAAFFERHHDAVFRYVSARVGSAAAEDVVAESFAAAYRARSRFDPAEGADARPWLYGIATRRLGRHRDAERRWLRNRGAAPIDRDSLGEAERIDALVDASRLAGSVAAALQQLSPRERDPLLLHVLAQLSYEEVAAALGVPSGTVRSRISRARTKLARLLDGVPR